MAIRAELAAGSAFCDLPGFGMEGLRCEHFAYELVTKRLTTLGSS
jgi:hypothetical protein